MNESFLFQRPVLTLCDQQNATDVPVKPERIAGKGCHVGTNQGGASGILRSRIDACERFPNKRMSRLEDWIWYAPALIVFIERCIVA
jgi:hypothetical protein